MILVYKSQAAPEYKFLLGHYEMTVTEKTISHVKSYFRRRNSKRSRRYGRNSNEEEDRLDKFETAIKNRIYKQFGDKSKPKHVDDWLNSIISD